MKSQSKYQVKIANSEELKTKSFQIRHEVFVKEQLVSHEDEFDEFENISRHFVALDSEESPVGAARWRRTDKGIKLERFAVAKEARGKGIGSMLVQAVLDDIFELQGDGQYLYLHAQLSAIPLYQKFSFKIVGPQFEECDIQHFKMELPR
ncbi:MAG: putative GNAT family N-acyltransferase [Cyclobacteriaceae bacterium]|jgi:predicted GNAT family N-acyltransferase